MNPLRKNIANAPPPYPFPNVCAQIASNTVETHNRYRFAVVPPSIRVVRLAQITEIENKTVARKAGSMVSHPSAQPGSSAGRLRKSPAFANSE